MVLLTTGRAISIVGTRIGKGRPLGPACCSHDSDPCNWNCSEGRNETRWKGASFDYSVGLRNVATPVGNFPMDGFGPRFVGGFGRVQAVFGDRILPGLFL